MAFQTRSDLEKCHKENKNGWDEDEIYFVADELRKASDKGYTDTVKELRRQGKKVVGIGEKKAPKELRDACSEFFEYSCAAEPPVRGGVSHLSRRNEPL